LCERPVVTLSTPMRDNSQLEVVGHERGGLVAANVDAMVQAMGRLADDPALRAKFGKQGRAWCLEQYDSPHVGRIMLRIATLALQHEDRTKLAAALAKDPLIQTDVTDKEIHDLLAKSVGKPSLFDRFSMWIVHKPWFYRFWGLVRRVHRKVKGPGDKQRFRLEAKAKAARDRQQSTAS